MTCEKQKNNNWGSKKNFTCQIKILLPQGFKIILNALKNLPALNHKMSIPKTAHPLLISILETQAYLKNYCFGYLRWGICFTKSWNMCSSNANHMSGMAVFIQNEKQGCLGTYWHVGAFRAGPVLCFYFKSIWNTPKYAQRGEWGLFWESVKNLNVLKNWISSFWSLEVHAFCIK